MSWWVKTRTTTTRPRSRSPAGVRYLWLKVTMCEHIAHAASTTVGTIGSNCLIQLVCPAHLGAANSFTPLSLTDLTSLVKPPSTANQSLLPSACACMCQRAWSMVALVRLVLACARTMEFFQPCCLQFTRASAAAAGRATPLMVASSASSTPEEHCFRTACFDGQLVRKQELLLNS
jgi:hypothetical protein